MPAEQRSNQSSQPFIALDYTGPTHPVLEPGSWPGATWLLPAPQPAHEHGLLQSPQPGQKLQGQLGAPEQGALPLAPHAEAGFGEGHSLPSAAGPKEKDDVGKEGRAVSESGAWDQGQWQLLLRGKVTPCADTIPASGPPPSCSAHGSPCVPACPGLCEEGH